MAIEMGEQTCAACGMARSEWKGNSGQGYTKEGQTYCCQGCAEGSGCTCS
jgi:hypothetical protein